MENYKISGKIKSISSTQQNGNFYFKNLVLEVDEKTKYPQHFKIQFSGDKIQLLDKFTPENFVLIKFSLKGKEWLDKLGNYNYFTTLNAFEIEII